MEIFIQNLLVILSGTPFDIAILQVKAPTLEYPDENIEIFYEQIEEVLKQTKAQDIKIIIGDFNAKVGEGSIENIIGPYRLGEINSRGERLVDWCKEHKLVVSNTWFANHPRR